MEVGIFDVSVDDIFYHLWIITFQCRTLSQNRLSIHSIEKLPVNVAKRSFYHNMQPGFVNYLCALPRCYRIRSWTEHAVVKAEEYTANNGGGVFQYIIISITCESFLFAVEFLVKTVRVAFRSRNYQWMLLICLTALLSNLCLNRRRNCESGAEQTMEMGIFSR